MSIAVFERMELKLRQTAPFAILLLTMSLAASGCFLAHGESPLPVDAGTPDSATPLPDASVPDSAIPPADASMPDAAPPSECYGPLTPFRPTRTSVELGGFGGMALPSDEPFDLPISVDDVCFCGEQLHCDVTVRRGEGLSPAIIELSTSVCDGAFLCDGCFPHLDGVCHVPALPAAEYRVRMNDDDAYVLTLPTWRSDTEEQICLSPAPPEPSGLICPWQSTTIDSAIELCVPSRIPLGIAARITLADGCGTCFDNPADCVVTQQGNRLIVDARTRTCDCPTCGACADICERVDTSCRLPPLPAGTYTVVTVDGALSATVRVVAGGVGGPTPEPTDCTGLVGVATP